MPECENCDEFVTEKYAQIFGNRDNEVKKCHNCLEGSRNNEREIAGLDPVGEYK